MFMLILNTAKTANTVMRVSVSTSNSCKTKVTSHLVSDCSYSWICIMSTEIIGSISDISHWSPNPPPTFIRFTRNSESKGNWIKASVALEVEELKVVEVLHQGLYNINKDYSELCYTPLCIFTLCLLWSDDV